MMIVSSDVHSSLKCLVSMARRCRMFQYTNHVHPFSSTFRRQAGVAFQTLATVLAQQEQRLATALLSILNQLQAAATRQFSIVNHGVSTGSSDTYRWPTYSGDSSTTTVSDNPTMVTVQEDLMNSLVPQQFRLNQTPIAGVPRPLPITPLLVTSHGQTETSESQSSCEQQKNVNRQEHHSDR